MPSSSPPGGSTVLAGRYELMDLLGAGAMADVFRARDTLLGREVALKVFRDSSTDATFDARQRAEIDLLARLNHPGLVTIFDAGSGLIDGTSRAFLVIELVRGSSLSERLAGGPLTPDESALLGTQVAESLAYIHDAGIVHRDVKPANILLPGRSNSGTTQPWIKLTDFGIARLVDEARLTSTGTLLGTPSYLSPEQATGTPPGPPTDVYALGLVLLECLTGVRVFPGTVLESLAARLHRDPAVPATLGPEWVALLTSMTAREPAARPTALGASISLRRLAAVPAPTRSQRTVEAGATQVLPSGSPAASLVGPPEPTRALSNKPTDTQLLPHDPGAPPLRPDHPTETQVLPNDPGAPPLRPNHPGATQILPASPPIDVPGPVPPAQATGRPDVAALPPTPPAAPRTRGVPPRHRVAVLIAAAFTAGAAITLAIGLGLSGGTQPDPAPSYPAVPGALGDHLQDLQGSVAP